MRSEEIALLKGSHYKDPSVVPSKITYQQDLMNFFADFTRAAFTPDDKENEVSRDRVCNIALYKPLLPKGDKEEGLRQAIKDCDLE